VSESTPTAGGPPPRRFNWDMLAALMAVFVGACALGVSVYTAQLQRKQIEAQAWPYLQLWRSNMQWQYSLSNRGVGPAQIRDMKLWVDGVEVASWEEAFTRVAGRPLECYKQSFVSRRVLAANEDVAMFELCNQADFDAFDAAARRVQREFCYCSVLDDCWLLSERAASEAEFLRRVDACPVGAAGSFR
jgi:hypothetical protein